MSAARPGAALAAVVAPAGAACALPDDMHLIFLRALKRAAHHGDGLRDGEFVIFQEDGAGVEDVADDVCLFGFGQRHDIARLQVRISLLAGCERVA